MTKFSSQLSLLILSRRLLLYGQLGIKVCLPFQVLFRRKIDLRFGTNRRAERGGNPIVVPRRDGIKLMIVTACTTDGQTQKRNAGGHDHVVQFVVTSRLKFGFGQLSRKSTGSQKPGGHHRQRVVRGQFIAGQLPLHELVIGNVGVQGPDQEVAIVVRIGSVIVLFIAVRFCKASDIHPVPGPAFAILRRLQQPINKL